MVYFVSCKKKQEMKYRETDIPGVWIVEPNVFTDKRGYFMESYKREEFEAHIGKVDFIQENESRSTKGVLRGLHYQAAPYSQAKLVRVIRGKVLDVAVDIRIGSPTFGRYVAIELSEENKLQLYMPQGFAHGFKVLSEEAVFTYKVDNPYMPSHEHTISYNDPVIGIDWRIEESSEVILSEKDRSGCSLREAELTNRF